MPLEYSIDKRKIPFYTDNSIMLTLLNIARTEMSAISAKYSIVLNLNSMTVKYNKLNKGSYLEILC